jgi:hypothetical protein
MGFIFFTLLELAFVAYHDKNTFLREQRRRRFSQANAPKLSCAFNYYTTSSGSQRPSYAYDARAPSLVTLNNTMEQALLQQPTPRTSLLWRKRKRQCAMFVYVSKVFQDPDLGPKVDKISSIAFPTAFAIFNLIYWVYYLRPNEGRQES